MRSVVGVSVGAGTIQLARPRRGTAIFDIQPVAAHGADAAALAAESVVDEVDSDGYPRVAAITYRDAQQASQLCGALDQRRVDDYQLVPETSAVLKYFRTLGEEPPAGATAIYDLGATGLTVTILDWHSGDVYYSQRTTEFSGDYVDALIRDQQLELGTVDHPQQASDLLLLDQQCRAAKEELVHTNAAAVPGELGVVLLAQQDFHNLISGPAQAAARFAQEVVWRSGAGVGSVIAVGGGSRIELVREALTVFTGLPIITDPDPDTVAARGAAIVADEFAATLPEPLHEPTAPVVIARPASYSAGPQRHSANNRRTLVIAGAAGAAVLAAVGIGLMVSSGSGGEKPAPAAQPLLPATTAAAPITTEPAPTTTPEPAETTPEPAPKRPVARRQAAPMPPPPPSIQIPGLPPIYLPGPPPPPAPMQAPQLSPPGAKPFPGLAPR